MKPKPIHMLVALCLLVLCESRTITINSNSTLGIEYYLCNDTNLLESNTTIEVSSDIHYLPEGPMCRIENLTDLTIRGADGSGEPSLVICQGDHDIVLRGFFFFNVTNLLIENIWFTNCGTTIPNDLPAGTNDTFSFFGSGQKAVFLFSHCTDVHLENLLLDRNFGIGVVGINLMGATELSHVTIQNTDNTRHLLCQGFVPTDLSCSGSGVAFVYADDAVTTAFGENVTLTISDSEITNNINTIPLRFFVPLYVSARAAFQTVPLLLTGAAGLAIYMGQIEYHVDMYMYGTKLDKNVGEIGGMLLLWYNTVRNSNVYIENSSFSNNEARGVAVVDNTRGGAILVVVALYIDQLHSFPEYPDDIYDLLFIRGSTFHSNCAGQGGAIYLHITPQNVTNYIFTVENTTFIKNIATSGSAMAAASLRSTFIPKATHILLQDIEAYGNTFPDAVITGSDTVENSAIFDFFHIHNVTITGKSNHGSRIYNNTPGAVLTSGGNVFLRGHVTFEDNFAFNGGALSLYDSSLLFIHEGSRLHFTRNRALQSGGAIYSNALSTGIADTCVIQIIGPSRIFSPSEADLLNLDLQFVNNTAGEAGNSIHANPIYNCYYLPEGSVQRETISILDSEKVLYDAIFNFSSTVDNGIREITSIPTRVCICNQTAFSQTFCQFIPQILHITTVPGKSFTIHLVAIDRVVTPVVSFVYVEIEADDDVADSIALAPAQNLRQIPGNNCMHVDFNLYSPANTNPLINLYATPGGLPVTINVTVESCPPGFQLESINGLLQCTCDDFITDQIDTTCNETRFTVLRPENTWIGVDSSTKEVSYISLCPIHYCNDRITEVNLSIPDQLCENGRSGILCGECEASLSVIFGSAKCSDCSSLWLLTIPLYAIAGVLLVFLLFLLDLTVTKGTINGLILYANLISVNANIFYRGTSQQFLFVFISLLNLELGFPICFFDGMGETAKVGLQFVFPAYLMVLCGGIIYLSRWSRRMQKLLSSSGVQVLATLIYLSYAKILRTVIDILSFATLRSKGSQRLIWLFDGNINYFEGIHVFHFMVAIVVILAFVLPYTFSLALIVLVQRIPYVIPRLKPLIDAYLGPYKDRWRYWFGLRLLLLGIMYIIYASLGTDNPELALLLQLLFITTFALFQTTVRPYKNTAVEILDMSFIYNFIILAIATTYTIDDTHANDNQKHVVRPLLSVTFITFVGIITYHSILQLRKIRRFKDGTDKAYIDITAIYKNHSFSPGLSSKGMTPHEVAAEMVDTPRNSGVTVTTIDIRSSEDVSVEYTPGSSERNTAETTETRTRTSTETTDFSKFREGVLDFS